MKCFPMRLDDGTPVIMCGSFPGEKHCVVCGTLATRLCDHRNSDRRTCDAPMCDEHAAHAGPNRDFCPLHKPKETQPALFDLRSSAVKPSACSASSAVEGGGA